MRLVNGVKVYRHKGSGQIGITYCITLHGFNVFFYIFKESGNTVKNIPLVT